MARIALPVRLRRAVAWLVASFLVMAVPAVASAQMPTQPVTVSISPEPQELKGTGSGFPLPPVVDLVVGEGADEAAVESVVETLRRADVRHIVRAADQSGPPAPVTVWLGSAADPDAAAVLGTLGVPGPDDLPAEGYVLATGDAPDTKVIAMVGKDERGAFYATQTFRQLLAETPGLNQVPGVTIRDWPTMAVRGVIEGFYGMPWSQEERLSQLAFYGERKMNTYVYAPKDDPYHRDSWREPYPPNELADLAELTDAAAANHVDFVWTISPGLDICYSSDEDFDILVAKSQAAWDAGVRRFALLLDDIIIKMNCAQDEARFAAAANPAAAAQAYLLNRFKREFLGTHEGAAPLITVPTEYHQEGTSPYREQFADLVDPEILVYWTGIGITTDTITNDDAAKTSAIFKHDLLIWDNFPANDFDRSRVFLGPLTGRDAELTEHGVRGLTANPMEHAEASKIALSTVADYTWNPAGYDPSRSWEHSLRRLGGDHAPALRTFAENALSSPLRRDESPVLRRLIESFWAAYEQGDADAEGQALIAAFTELERAARVLAEEFDNAAFVAEMNPWLDKMRHYGVAGRLATTMLLAQQDGDRVAVDALRAELDDELTNDLTDITIAEPRQDSRPLDGVDTARGWAELVMYTPHHGDTTGTNQWGYEVTVVDGRVVAVGGNNSPIPDDGYVLSVHSAGDGDWLRKNAIVGSTVLVEDTTVIITTAAGVYHVPNLVTYARGVAQPFLNRSVSTNDGWLGRRDEAGPFSTLPAFGAYALENMSDGDHVSLYWTAKAPRTGDYLGIDLGEVKPISRLEVHMASTSGPAPRPGDYIRHGSLQVSVDGSRWTTLGEYRDQPEIITDLAAPTPARFVRLQVLTDQTSWAQIREFVVR